MPNSLKSFVFKALPPSVFLRGLKYKHVHWGDPELKLIPYLIPKGTDAIDVGVYHGVYTSVMADHAEKVYAFEPHPSHYAFIKKALPKKVETYQVALSNEEGEAELVIPVEYESAGSISKEFSGRKVNSFHVKTKLLDQFHLKNIGFIKIDAEGHEYEIILGGRNTIMENKPNLVIEIEQRHISRPIQEVFNEVLNMGYKGYYFFDGKTHSIDQFSVEKLQPMAHIGDHKYYVNNFMFVHESRKVNFPY